MDIEDKTPLGAFLRSFPDCSVIRYDARGHGRSDPGGTEPDHSWERLGQDLLELLDLLQLKRVIAAGASMGAAATLHAVLRSPERFSGLLLVMPPTAWETRANQAILYRSGAALIEREGIAAFIELLRRTLLEQSGSDELDPGDVAFLEGLKEVRPPVLMRVLRGAAASDLPEPGRLAQLAIPTLVIAVRNDPGHPESTGQRIAECIPGARLLSVANRTELTALRDPVHDFLHAIPE
jgi:pimeloyl-ACP methyl ester carboxylesterase